MIKPILTAIVVLVVFIVSFIAFMLAPLLMIFIVAGGMWGLERWQKSRRRPGIRTLSTPASLNPAGSSREIAPDLGYGFGAGAGREL